MSQRKHEQIVPQNGYVEHSAEEIFGKVQLCLTDVAQQMQRKHISLTEVICAGITCQRETIVVWDKVSGVPFCNAIVWSDMRNAELLPVIQQELDALKIDLKQRTGLPLSTYFSGSKLRWLIENDSEIALALAENRAIVGTIDSFLIYKLTQYSKQGPSHVTDISNASRTQMFNITTLTWDETLTSLFKVPHSALPRILPSSSKLFGTISVKPFNGVPITGVAGDQQAALFGHCCFEQNEAKCTFGTGAFLLTNIGHTLEYATNGLLTTVGYQIEGQDVVYAHEGSVAAAGSTLEWLVSMGIVKNVKEIDQLISENTSNGITFVPAFSGLFCPHWRPDARGVILGLSFGTQPGNVCCAALEAIALQVDDMLQVIRKHMEVHTLAVDGGIVNSSKFRQILATITNTRVELREMLEVTALGAALLAGLAQGVYESLEEVKQCVKQEVFLITPEECTEYCKDVKRRWMVGIERSLNLAE
ncbi:Glycerol_kinase [Hexamita inflata]|uniref:glycerol kinase n=1 Tax=Hexamita inflata TaxID=28002 RepID=A0AA86TVI7_9EUKA|nr:Glycerol kinase [Hexamita inflata]